METNKKIIWNAVSAYFMFFICLSFLWSKNTNINDPFVKTHVKTAFTIQLWLILSLIIMSFVPEIGFSFIGYSPNTIITIILCFFFFGALGYGAYKAQHGETVTTKEVFQTTWIKRNILIQNNQLETDEETKWVLIFAHIPFIGYMLYGRHQELDKIKDIVFLNLIVTCIAVVLTLIGFTSLASIIMLTYIIWSVYQSIRLISQNELTTIDTAFIPTPEKKYIIHKALWVYTFKMLSQKKFESLQAIISRKYAAYIERERIETLRLSEKKQSAVPSFLFYIPIINILGLFFLQTQESTHIKNGIVITLFTLLIIVLFGFSSSLLLLILFPVFYGIGYHTRLWYHMPYIYNVYGIFAWTFTNIKNIFHKTKVLQNTVKSNTITIQNTVTNNVTKIKWNEIVDATQENIETQDKPSIQ